MTNLEAHWEVLNLFVHVLLFLQGDCSLIQPRDKIQVQMVTLQI